MELHVYKDSETLSNATAKFVADHIAATLKKQTRYTIALSGGSTPVRLHQLLAQSPYKDQIDWSKLHVFWGDERAVPFDDDRNNAKMAYETLLNFVPVPAEQIHVMRTDIDPTASAAEYEKICHQYFDNTATSFDLVLLGMGDDGHTLSLFPGMPVIHEEKLWTTAFWLQAQDMYRITLTRTLVNRSACVVFLTAGAKKAHALKEVLKGAPNPDLYPSQVIKPVGELHWFVDEAAAADLK
ncbi:MAG TPA: 6-phosphogluconolactonase [Puia sp.]|uniref:6-phosphogluconolactonase n=1 Tax=Puia sp. TaxID=2045100 RepID=UPI002C6F18AB|nr:6-phosphogluconolactonase [Puia sp.]HVU97122.1 6-phosphogluconolactonase [Puia sp.]